MSSTARSIRPLPFSKNVHDTLSIVTCEQIKSDTHDLTLKFNKIKVIIFVKSSSESSVDNAKSPQSCPVAAVAENILL